MAPEMGARFAKSNCVTGRGGGERDCVRMGWVRVGAFGHVVRWVSLWSGRSSDMFS